MGEKKVGWQEDDAIVIARTGEYGHSLVVLNRSYDTKTISQDLSSIGLPGGNYRELLSNQPLSSNGTVLSIEIPPQSSKLLIWEN